MKTYLTENFTLEELTRSQYAKRHGIDNTPTKEQIENLRYLCVHGLQPLRDWLQSPVYVSSGFRCDELNYALKGSSTSLHKLGCASDIDDRGSYTLMQIVTFIHNHLPFTELIAEYFPGGWVHYGLCKGRDNEKVLKLKDENHNYEIVQLSYIKGLYT